MMYTEGTPPMPVKPYLILHYPANEVAKILTRVNEDVCKTIHNYFDGKLNPADIKDFIDVINGTFIYHKGEITKERDE